VQSNSIRITLACMARKKSAVNEFIENLEEIKDFSRVLISSEDREGGTITFPLTMEYSPVEPGSDPAPAVGAEGGTVDAAAGAEAASEPLDELAEAVRAAYIPDPDAANAEYPEVEAAPNNQISDPFAISGDDPFAAGGAIFGESGEGFGGEAFSVPPAEPEPAGEQAPEAGRQGNRTRNSGDLIKRPPAKPGERRRQRPSGGGGR
jgi:hypothetical protein